jgi:hypothetical protein
MKFRAEMFLGFLVLLSACAGSPPGDLYDPRSVPLTASPQQRLAVSGILAPGMLVPEVIARYSTAVPHEQALRSPSCEAWINHLEGVAGPKNIEVHIPTTTEGGTVRAVVQVDRYKPGDCNWVLSEIRVVVQGTSGQTYEQRIATGYAYERARFYGITPNGKPNNNVVFSCAQKHRFFCSPHIGGPDGVDVLVTRETRYITFQAQQSG